ncbi:peptide deformylase [Promicromonospora kroppenstedtii]|uniref:peptide deformylase n=1 Tax=Promicromonospora kroppenstedtii TaxID=440482 RepID=UPI0004AEEA69|nr:peptide deformylase [Promicromonospora kroppenstedtii]
MTQRGNWTNDITEADLVAIGDPRLQAPTAEIEAPEARDVLDALTTLLRSLHGAGLAAPQIGVSVRAAIVEVRKTEVFPDRPETGLIQILNPTILERSAETALDWEGCFSVPGYMGLVPRSESITVRYTDETGQTLTSEVTGYAARVFQHEIDHLDGLVYLDRMPDMTTLTTTQNYLDHHRPGAA